MKQLLTPKQVARAIGVSEASLKRWCDKDLLPSTRTAGGHRRLPLTGVLEFLRQTNRPLVQPEVLGLPPTSGTGETVLERAVPRFYAALEAGDLDRVRAIIFDLHLAGHSVESIGDRVIAPAFRQVGDNWETGALEVYQEHRGAETCLRSLYQLGEVVPTPATDAPVAIGGTICGDPYQLPITLVELALRQQGWRADSLGPNHPAETLIAAMQHHRPRLVWISVSWYRSADEFLDEYNRVFVAAEREGIAVAVGGNALSDDVRQQMRYSAFCDTLAHLTTFVHAIYHPAPAEAHS